MPHTGRRGAKRREKIENMTGLPGPGPQGCPARAAAIKTAVKTAVITAVGTAVTAIEPTMTAAVRAGKVTC